MASCARCGVTLLVDSEVDRQYAGGRSFIGQGAGDSALTFAAQRQRSADACGVSCPACAHGFCVRCMKSLGRPHPTSGGLACLDCGGQLTHFRG
jgi:hypothetical protein